MIAALLGLLAAGLAVAAGAPWWTLFAAAPFAVPGRIGPVVGAVAVAVLLPWGAGPIWRDFLFLACGILAGWSILHRIGHAVAWVAVPWWVAGLALLELAWSVASPGGFWSASDVAVRLRLLVVGALACVGLAVHYLPRYRNGALLPDSPGDGGGVGTTGARDETR